MRASVLALLLLGSACESVTTRWKMEEPLSDPGLEIEIFRALDAASKAGTHPPLSKFKVRTATIVDGRAIVGGNTEYLLPEAIHGESALVNHVINLFGPEETREKVRFIAYYAERCGDSCPDVVLLQPRRDDYGSEVPRASDALLVIEVADTTLRFDRTIKKPRCAAAGVPELWIVDLEGSRVWVHRNPLEGDYGEVFEARSGDVPQGSGNARRRDPVSELLS